MLGVKMLTGEPRASVARGSPVLYPRKSQTQYPSNCFYQPPNISEAARIWAAMVGRTISNPADDAADGVVDNV